MENTPVRLLIRLRDGEYSNEINRIANGEPDLSRGEERAPRSESIKTKGSTAQHGKWWEATSLSSVIVPAALSSVPAPHRRKEKDFILFETA